VRKVASNGVFCYRRAYINIGMRYAGARVAIVEEGELVHVYYGDELVRSLAPDSTRRYQRRERTRRSLAREI
jgi:hypothetical protein